MSSLKQQEQPFNLIEVSFAQLKADFPFKLKFEHSGIFSTKRSFFFYSYNRWKKNS